MALKAPIHNVIISMKTVRREGWSAIGAQILKGGEKLFPGTERYRYSPKFSPALNISLRRPNSRHCYNLLHALILK